MFGYIIPLNGIKNSYRKTVRIAKGRYVSNTLENRKTIKSELCIHFLIT